MPERICSVDGCTRDARCRGWCNTHYERWRRNGDPGGGDIQQRRELEDRTCPLRGGPCAVDGCENDAAARGWCTAHYIRWRRSGDPLGSASCRGTA